MPWSGGEVSSKIWRPVLTDASAADQEYPAPPVQDMLPRYGDAVSSVSWEADSMSIGLSSNTHRCPDLAMKRQSGTVLSFIAASGSASAFSGILALWRCAQGRRPGLPPGRQPVVCQGGRDVRRLVWQLEIMQGRARCIGRGVMGKVAQG